MSSPIFNFKDNITQVVSLLDIHEEKTGDKPGRRYDVEILNKSSIVLTTACWEAFVEDIVSYALMYLLDNCSSPSVLPKNLLKTVAKEVRQDKHELRVFDIAGEGWRKVMIKHKDNMLRKHIGPFTNPKFGNVDALMKKVLGVDEISKCWHWKGMSNKNARKKLNEYISLRGSIAHRLVTNGSVTKNQANNYAIFIIRIAIKTSNHLRRYVHNVAGSYPWEEATIGKKFK